MNTTYAQEQESLARVLRDKIFKYKAARPNLSSSQIASKFGMSSSTFCRLENLDIKTPTFDQIIKVFNGTGSDEDLITYLKRNYPRLVEVFNESISNGVSPFMNQDLCEYLESPSTSKIMVLAGSKSGLPIDLVKEEFGNNGVKVCDDLYEKGILVINENNYFINSEVKGVTNKTILDLIKNSANDFFDLEGLNNGDSLNYLSFRSESIDLDRVYPQIVSLLKETNTQIKSIMDNPDNMGESTVFVGMISDSIIRNTICKEKEVLQ